MLTCALQGVGVNHPTKYEQAAARRGRVEGLLRPVFHFNRTVPKRSVFLCLVSFQAELMTLGQKKTLRFSTVRLEWKTGLRAPQAATIRHIYLTTNRSIAN